MLDPRLSEWPAHFPFADTCAGFEISTEHRQRHLSSICPKLRLVLRGTAEHVCWISFRWRGSTTLFTTACALLRNGSAEFAPAEAGVAIIVCASLNTVHALDACADTLMRQIAAFSPTPDHCASTLCSANAAAMSARISTKTNPVGMAFRRDARSGLPVLPRPRNSDHVKFRMFPRHGDHEQVGQVWDRAFSVQHTLPCN